MKQLFTLSKAGLLLVLILLCACNKTGKIIEPENTSQLMLKESTKPKLLLFSCSGSGQCLPVIDINASAPGSSTPGVTISWYIPSGNDHHFSLSCTGVSTYSQILTNSGSMFFSTNDSAYKLSYKLSCISSSSCANCKKSETFVKKANQTNGNIGSYNDCQKEYLDYQAETDPYTINKIKIICTSPWYQQSNESDFLKVDSYKIFKTSYGSSPVLVQSGALTPGLTDIYVPNDPAQYYEMRLYSSACEHNEEHYLYKSYQGTGGTGFYVIDPYSFLLAKAH